MARRIFDLLLASATLVFSSPLLLAAVVGIMLSSPGPVIYRSLRAGRHGKVFTMYKLRTMRAEPGPRIAARDDRRVYPLGRWLRRTRIDELPQLVNVLKGEMSIVGPRPEDPSIVESFYTPRERQTLAVRPGLVSPGSIYYITHTEALLAGDDVEQIYLDQVLRQKLALDLVYVERASLGYDVWIVLRALCVLLLSELGKRRFPDPPEMNQVFSVAP